MQCDHHSYRDIVNPSPAISPKALTALHLGRVDLLPISTSTSTSFPVIFDTGASLAITHDKSDFAGPIRSLVNQRLGGLANGLNIVFVVCFR